MRSLTWQEVWERRLGRHSLLTPARPHQLVEVVRAVSGIHAQMLSAAELSIGIRVAGISDSDVQCALWEDRSLVKTYGIRGTIHLFPADDLPLWTAALRAKPRGREERRLAEFGLDPAQVETLVATIGEALDGCCLTREELGVEVVRRAGAWAGDAVSPAFGSHWPRWLIVLGDAAAAGLLCFGPNRGANVTFVRPDQWLGPQRALDGGEALKEVFRRYLACYGPATHRDFAQWFNMPLRSARALAESLAGDLEEVDVEGYRAWLPRGQTEAAGTPARDLVRLLPHFDCYAIGCHPRDRLVPPAWRERVVTRGSVGNRPVVIVDGIVGGLWQQQQTAGMLEVRVEMFEPMNAARSRALEGAVERVAAFQGREGSLTLGTVEVRPHL